MATVTLRTETSGIRPQFEHGEDSVRRAYSDDPVVGGYLRREIEPVARRRFYLRWPDTNEGERYLLLQAWEDSFSGTLAMDYTPIDDVDANSIEVVFMGPPNINPRRGRRFSMSVDIEEAP